MGATRSRIQTKSAHKPKIHIPCIYVCTMCHLLRIFLLRSVSHRSKDNRICSLYRKYILKMNVKMKRSGFTKCWASYPFCLFCTFFRSMSLSLYLFLLSFYLFVTSRSQSLHYITSANLFRSGFCNGIKILLLTHNSHFPVILKHLIRTHYFISHFPTTKLDNFIPHPFNSFHSLFLSFVFLPYFQRQLTTKLGTN